MSGVGLEIERKYLISMPEAAFLAEGERWEITQTYLKAEDGNRRVRENPEQYITKVGKFIRAHSLDELPQIWDIFIGNMSVIGIGEIIKQTKKNPLFSEACGY